MYSGLHEIVQNMLEELASPEVLPFPGWHAVISGDSPLRLTLDASVDGVGAVVDQKQADGVARPLAFSTRSTLPNDHNWSPTE